MTQLIWRWRTTADPNRPRGTARIAHPLAERVGEPVELLAQSATNGNRLLRVGDGLTVVAPFYAAAMAKRSS